jgi:hypothetical protein
MAWPEYDTITTRGGASLSIVATKSSTFLRIAALSLSAVPVHTSAVHHPARFLTLSAKALASCSQLAKSSRWSYLLIPKHSAFTRGPRWGRSAQPKLPGFGIAAGRARLFAAGREKLRPSPSPQRHQAINPLLHGIAAREPRGYSWEREKDPFQSGRQQLTEYQWMSERTWMGAGMDGCTLVLLHATHCSRIKR